MKKMYRVDFGGSVIVYAESSRDAVSIAVRYATDEVDAAWAEEMAPDDRLPSGWTQTTLVYQAPYSGGDLTVADARAEINQQTNSSKP
jgi:hypothetical protein